MGTRINIEKELLKIENYQLLSYKELAIMLDTNDSKIKRTFEKLGIEKIKKKVISDDIIITSQQEQVIIGSLLGDGYMSKHFWCEKNKKQYNSQMQIKHGFKQRNYLKYKQELLGDLSLDIYIEEIGTGFDDSIRIGCRMNVKKCKEMNIYRDLWYGKNGKFIPESELRKLEPLGLAIWFMDDGSWHTSSIKLATMCFSDFDLLIIQKVMLEKFNLDFSICADKTLYLKRKSLDRFYFLIKPYLFEELAYKIPVRDKLCELLEKPDVVNQQPSVVEIPMKVQRLEVLFSACKDGEEPSTSAQIYSIPMFW